MTKILFATGGTGGHIFPAQALADALRNRDMMTSVYFAGGGLSQNRYLSCHGIECYDVSHAPFSLRAPLKNIYNITRGIWQSRNIIQSVSPDVIVGFGSYHSFPVIMAARLLNIPFVLYESNSIPGRVTRFFSKAAAVTALTLGDSSGLLRGGTVPVSMPSRLGYVKSVEGRCEGYSYFGFDGGRTTILVFGGSQGARGINNRFRSAIETMSPIGTIQILHFVGRHDDCEEYRSFYRERHIPACVKTFEQRMDLAWNTADVFISRAGAATIAEQEIFEVPGILIPYPYSLDGHQDANALYMSEKVGGARVLSEVQCTPDFLGDAIQKLIREKDDMKAKIVEYKKNDLRRDLCDVIENIVRR